MNRLARATGGRLTQRTNDLTLAVARAERDLGCRYTLGVYVLTLTHFRRHEIQVEMRRPGLRIHHPGAYWFPSSQDRQRREAELVPLPLVSHPWLGPSCLRLECGRVKA